MKRINVIKYGVELDSKRHPKLVPEDRYRFKCEGWKIDDWKYTLGTRGDLNGMSKLFDEMPVLENERLTP